MKIKFQFNVSLQKDAEEKKNTVTVDNSSFVDCARKEILNARERGSFSTAANYDTALRSLLTFIKREDIMLRNNNRNARELSEMAVETQCIA